MATKPMVRALKSYSAGHVKLHITAKTGWNSTSISTTIALDISLEEAKVLQSELLIQIEKSEAKLTVKDAAENRRKEWREREIKAGRLKVMSFNSL